MRASKDVAPRWQGGGCDTGLTGIEMLTYYEVPIVSCGFLVGRKIIVKDFQTNVKTRNGDGRYVVLIEEGGSECKFLTNNPRMKDVLNQCREQNAFPFEATFKRRALNGNKVDYYFE